MGKRLTWVEALSAIKEDVERPEEKRWGDKMRCAVKNCPMLRDDGIKRERCPEPEMLCEYVRCSIDPEDMPTWEEWVAQHGKNPVDT